MPGPCDLFAQIQARKDKEDGGDGVPAVSPLAAMLKSRNFPGGPPKPKSAAATAAPEKKKEDYSFVIPEGKLFAYDEARESFVFDHSKDMLVPKLEESSNTIVVPLAPCAYRMTDYTLAKKEPVELRRCVLKLNVLRCLQRECVKINDLLKGRFGDCTDVSASLEEDELGKARFLELLSNCGVFQKVSELILQRVGQLEHAIGKDNSDGTSLSIPKVRVDGLDDFLRKIEELTPSLKQARDEIANTQSVSFYPGLGELFCPGSQLITYPDGMEGSPLGCSVVQAWYAEDLNKATGKMKRRFILVVEYIVSVGTELVFVAASDVYPEFHDVSRNVPIKDLKHRKLDPNADADASILSRLQQRGEFYASVATNNHYLEYYPNSFFPIITGGGWSNNAIRPLSKGGRVMVDVRRGILEGHLPVRSGSASSGGVDGFSDTVKEAIKLFDQSQRTGVAVPFRTCILNDSKDSDSPHLWQSWPMLTGFSFTARVWGKLLLGMPATSAESPAGRNQDKPLQRSPSERLGVQVGGLGGQGSCGNCGYIQFQEKAFDQLVLDDDKKELIRAVARNAGGVVNDGDDGDDGDEDSDSDDDEDVGLDIVANKGAASIFLLNGPPGCGKTLTAEAISELLRKPLYIITAGDLGITAAEVEKTLGSVLELCQTWDALVLIDEADVFLEARNSSEIQRNALVCVMLRLLEYYSGCLFLSSNRPAKSIDAAIASRITVMLAYPPLTAEGRTKVWKNLIELVPALPAGGKPKKKKASSKYRLEFSEEEYHTLAHKYELNGRQIKNSIVLARALARERGMPLSVPILQRAVTAVAGEIGTE